MERMNRRERRKGELKNGKTEQNSKRWKERRKKKERSKDNKK